MSDVPQDGLLVTFTASSSSGWGYVMLAAEADYATLTIRDVKAFVSAVGDASCKWSGFVNHVASSVLLSSCRLLGGKSYRLFVYVEDGHLRDDGTLAEPMLLEVPASNNFTGSQKQSRWSPFH